MTKTKCGTTTDTRRAFLRAMGGTAASAPVLGAFGSCRYAPNRVAGTPPSESQVGTDLAAEYDLDETVIYLNHASIGTVPRRVREARAQLDRQCESNPWYYVWGGGWEQMTAEAHETAAAYLGCDIEEIAITHNTTESFNLLASGLPLGPGDEVVFSSLNHVGASACWDHYSERRGFTVRRFDLPLSEVRGANEEDLVRLHSEQVDERTAVLVIPHMDNWVGLRHPIARIAAAARAKGARFVAVDAAQSVGMLDLRAAETGADFLATSAHKWTQAPKGTGLLYVRREVQPDLRPMQVTWGQRSWQGTARSYADYGTRDFAAVLALASAIRFQTALSDEKKQARLAELREHAWRRVDAESKLRWHSPRSWEGGGSLFAIEVVETPPKPLASELFREHGIVVRPFDEPGAGALRVSPNLINTSDQLDLLFEAILRRA